MKKFTFGYMILLAFFVVIGIGMILFYSNDDSENKIDEDTINKTPGLNTMLTVSDMVSAQQLEADLINVEVKPTSNKLENIVLELQGNNFVTEDLLLKDSYNLFVDARKVSTLQNFTIIWYSNIATDNGAVLTITLSKEQCEQLASLAYTDISKIASSYTKDNALK